MIIRTARRDRYVVISKVPLEDTRLSWRARGLLSYLLSKPDNWTVMIAHLVNEAPDGRSSVMAALRELEANGYLWRTKRRVAGQFDGVDSEVYEEPQPDLTEVRFSDCGFSDCGFTDDGKSDANEYIHSMKKERLNNESSAPAASVEVMHLCQLLSDRMVQNGCKKPTITKAWTSEMDRLLRLDGRTYEEVEWMIEWCQSDNFWRANVLSPKKLRSNFDNMRLQSKRARPGRRSDRALELLTEKLTEGTA